MLVLPRRAAKVDDRDARRARADVGPAGRREEHVLGLEVGMRELDRVQVGERPEAVEGHARDRSEREEAACVQRLASRAPLRLALHAPQRMVQRGAELAEDEAAVPLGREAANQPPDRQVERRVLLHREQDLGLDLRLAAVLLDGTDDLDGDVSALLLIPHLDGAAECALAQLLDHPVALAIKPVVHPHDVVPFRPLLLQRPRALRRRAGRILGGALLKGTLLPGEWHCLLSTVTALLRVAAAEQAAAEQAARHLCLLWRGASFQRTLPHERERNTRGRTTQLTNLYVTKL